MTVYSKPFTNVTAEMALFANSLAAGIKAHPMRAMAQGTNVGLSIAAAVRNPSALTILQAVMAVYSAIDNLSDHQLERLLFSDVYTKIIQSAADKVHAAWMMITRKRTTPPADAVDPYAPSAPEWAEAMGPPSIPPFTENRHVSFDFASGPAIKLYVLIISALGFSLTEGTKATYISKAIRDSNSNMKSFDDIIGTIKEFLGVGDEDKLEALNALNEMADDLNVYRRRNPSDLYGEINQMKKLYKTSKDRHDNMAVFTKNDPSFTSAHRKLGTALIAFDKLICDVSKNLDAANSPRPTPSCLHVYGPPGAGKSTWVRNELIPMLAGKAGIAVKDNIYSVTSRAKYPPSYTGQAFMVIDEFLADPKEEYFFHAFNDLATNNQTVLSGAAVEEKQMVPRHQFLITISNEPRYQVNENHVHSTGPFAEAFNSRLNPLYIHFPKYNLRKERQDQGARELCLHYRPRNAKGKTIALPSKTVNDNCTVCNQGSRTHVDYIVDKMVRERNTNMQVYNDTLAAVHTTGGAAKVICLVGPVSTGKSHYINRLQADYTLKGFSVINASSVSPTRYPAYDVVIFDDWLPTRSSQYAEAYDNSLPSQVFIVSGNVAMGKSWRCDFGFKFRTWMTIPDAACKRLPHKHSFIADTGRVVPSLVPGILLEKTLMANDPHEYDETDTFSVEDITDLYVPTPERPATVVVSQQMCPFDEPTYEVEFTDLVDNPTAYHVVRSGPAPDNSIRAITEITAVALRRPDSYISIIKYLVPFFQHTTGTFKISFLAQRAQLWRNAEGTWFFTNCLGARACPQVLRTQEDLTEMMTEQVDLSAETTEITARSWFTFDPQGLFAKWLSNIIMAVIPLLLGATLGVFMEKYFNGKRSIVGTDISDIDLRRIMAEDPRVQECIAAHKSEGGRRAPKGPNAQRRLTAEDRKYRDEEFGHLLERMNDSSDVHHASKTLSPPMTGPHTQIKDALFNLITTPAEQSTVVSAAVRRNTFPLGNATNGAVLWSVCIEQNRLVFPAHLLSHPDDTIKLKRDDKIWNIRLTAVHWGEDLAFGLVRDSSWPFVKSIAHFLIDELSLEALSGRHTEPGFLMRVLPDAASVHYGGLISYSGDGSYGSCKAFKKRVAHLTLPTMHNPIREGDCGSPLIISEPRYGTKIIAGFLSYTGIGHGGFCVLTREQYNLAFPQVSHAALLPTIDLVPTDDIGIPNLYMPGTYHDAIVNSTEPSQYEIKKNDRLKVHSLHPKFRGPLQGSKSKFKPMPEPPNEPTKFVPSPMSFKALPLATQESFPANSEGRKSRGMSQMIKNAITETTDPFIEHAHVLDSYSDWFSEFFEQGRKLTDFEVVNGVMSGPLGEVKSMDMNSSVGPYLKNVANAKDKHALFEQREDGMYHWKTTVAATTALATIRAIEQSPAKPVEFPVGGTLKDELLPRKKVMEGGKIRQFQNVDFMSLFISKKYLGFFIGLSIRAIFEIHHTAGFDPMVDFGKLYNALCRHKNFLTYDFKAYDKTLPRWSQAAFAKVLKRILSEVYDRDDYLIACRQVDSAVDRTEWFEGHLFTVKGGISSGHYLTNFMNSGANDMITLAVISHIIKTKVGRAPSFAEINENYCWFTHGDDVIASVSDAWADHVNYFTMHEAIKEVAGMDVTPGNKEAKPVKFEKMVDTTFLKRKLAAFHSKAVGALDRDSIEKTLEYTRDMNEAHLIELWEGSLFEAILHGKPYYQAIRKTVLDQVKATGAKYSPPTYHDSDTRMKVRQGMLAALSERSEAPIPYIENSGSSSEEPTHTHSIDNLFDSEPTNAHTEENNMAFKTNITCSTCAYVANSAYDWFMHLKRNSKHIGSDSTTDYTQEAFQSTPLYRYGFNHHIETVETHKHYVSFAGRQAFGLSFLDHDDSKLSANEILGYVLQWSLNIQDTQEYKLALQHHYDNNRHHPNSFEGVMSDYDLKEAVADMVGCSLQRTHGGDPANLITALKGVVQCFTERSPFATRFGKQFDQAHRFAREALATVTNTASSGKYLAFPCPCCPISCRSGDALDKHVLNSHAGKHSCWQCGGSFGDHEDDCLLIVKYRCTTCGVLMASEAKGLAHAKASRHAGIFPDFTSHASGRGTGPATQSNLTGDTLLSEEPPVILEGPKSMGGPLTAAYPSGMTSRFIMDSDQLVAKLYQPQYLADVDITADNDKGDVVYVARYNGLITFPDTLQTYMQSHRYLAGTRRFTFVTAGNTSFTGGFYICALPEGVDPAAITISDLQFYGNYKYITFTTAGTFHIDLQPAMADIVNTTLESGNGSSRNGSLAVVVNRPTSTPFGQEGSTYRMTVHTHFLPEPAAPGIMAGPYAAIPQALSAPPSVLTVDPIGSVVELSDFSSAELMRYNLDGDHFQINATRKTPKSVNYDLQLTAAPGTSDLLTFPVSTIAFGEEDSVGKHIQIGCLGHEPADEEAQLNFIFQSISLDYRNMNWSAPGSFDPFQEVAARLTAIADSWAVNTVNDISKVYFINYRGLCYHAAVFHPNFGGPDTFGDPDTGIWDVPLVVQNANTASANFLPHPLGYKRLVFNENEYVAITDAGGEIPMVGETVLNNKVKDYFRRFGTNVRFSIEHFAKVPCLYDFEKDNFYVNVSTPFYGVATGQPSAIRLTDIETTPSQSVPPAVQKAFTKAETSFSASLSVIAALVLGELGVEAEHDIFGVFETKKEREWKEAQYENAGEWMAKENAANRQFQMASLVAKGVINNRLMTNKMGLSNAVAADMAYNTRTTDTTVVKPEPEDWSVEHEATPTSNDIPDINSQDVNVNVGGGSASKKEKLTPEQAASLAKAGLKLLPKKKGEPAGQTAEDALPESATSPINDWGPKGSVDFGEEHMTNRIGGVAQAFNPIHEDDPFGESMEPVPAAEAISPRVKI